LAEPDKRGVVDVFMEYIDPAAWAIVPESRRAKYRDNYAALLREAQAATAQTVSAEDLRSIKVRCVILTGSTSHATLRTIARTLAAGIPDSELVEIEGSGHLIYLDKPDAFAEAVLRFAREILSTVPD